MDKKSILVIFLVSLSMALIMLYVVPLFTGTKKAEQAVTSQTAAPAQTALPAATAAPVAASGAAAKPAAPGKALAELEAEDNRGIPSAESFAIVENEVLIARFSSLGGQLDSLKLKKHKAKDGQPVEMVLKGQDGSWALAHSWGGTSTASDRRPMSVSRPDPLTVSFSRDYRAPGANGEWVRYSLVKTFSFRPDEYMFEVSMKITNSVDAAPSLNNGGYAYTLFYGPQMGPEFKQLSNYGETRDYRYYSAEKVRSAGVGKSNSRKQLPGSAVWAAVKGKYFSLIVTPDASPYDIVYNTHPVTGLNFVSQLSFSRKQISSANNTDRFWFYLGPNQGSQLGRYDRQETNGFAKSDLQMGKLTTGGWWSFPWLAVALKAVMGVFVRVVPNWGIAIILLTILVKLVLFPLSLKSSIGMAKMQELQPKLAELQAKYKDKPERYQQEMMEFYKKEGYNPLGGCLPMLIQLPIFMAMYWMFSTHFDLRGASFIPGWISDLSQPEALVTFGEVNLLVWKVDALRLLPIIYVVSQLFYGKFTQMSQPSPGQSATQMKIMLYGMPIMFFFVLYNSPSGLLVYWIAQNILTIVQQVVTNRIIHARKASQRS